MELIKRCVRCGKPSHNRWICPDCEDMPPASQVNPICPNRDETMPTQWQIRQCAVQESIYEVMAAMLEELKRLNEKLNEKPLMDDGTVRITGVFKLKMDWLSRPEVGESVCFATDGRVYSARYAGPDEKGKGIVLAVHKEDCTCDVLLNDNPPGGG